MAAMRMAVLAALVVAAGPIGGAHAALTGYQQGAVAGGTPAITFSEVSLYTLDPIYSIGGGPFAGLNISFGSYFTGQTLVSGYPVTLVTPAAPGAAPSIALTYGGYAITYTDAASPSNPVLTGASGYPSPSNFFAMPLAIAFSSPVPAVGLTIGSLAGIGVHHDRSLRRERQLAWFHHERLDRVQGARAHGPGWPRHIGDLNLHGQSGRLV